MNMMLRFTCYCWGCELKHQATNSRLYSWSMCFVGLVGFELSCEHCRFVRGGKVCCSNA